MTMKTNAAHALWDDRLDEELSNLVGRTASPVVAPTITGNVVRPVFPQAERSRPELATALDGLTALEGLLAGFQEQVERSGRADSETEGRLVEALRENESMAGRIADLEAGLVLAHEHLSRAHELAAAREQQILDKLACWEALLQDAGCRIFAAETRTMEAQEDVAYLEDIIRGNLAPN